MTVQEYVNVPHSRLFYTVDGAGSGHPLILLHGNFNDHKIWDAQVDFFTDFAKVIRFDLRGYGQSSTPAAAFSHVEDLKALMEYLNISKAALLGSSMGGGIAIDFALTYPELVQSLILVAPSIHGQRYPLKLWWKGFKNYYNLRAHGSKAAIEAFIEDPYWSYFFPSLQHTKARERVLQNIRNENNFCRFPPHLAQPIKPRSIKRLKDIHIPTLIVISNDDHPFNIETADLLSQKIPQSAKVSVHHCGHLPFVVNPEEFNKMVLDFINQTTLSEK